MKRILPSLLLLAIAASAEEVRLRWALAEGEHRIRSSVTQRISVTPPGQAPIEIDALIWSPSLTEPVGKS